MSAAMTGLPHHHVHSARHHWRGRDRVA